VCCAVPDSRWTCSVEKPHEDRCRSYGASDRATDTPAQPHEHRTRCPVLVLGGTCCAFRIGTIIPICSGGDYWVHTRDQSPVLRLLRDFLKRENWWVMISNADRFSATEQIWNRRRSVCRSFLAAAPDRAIWSTDWPHVQYRRPMPNDAELLEFLFRVAPGARLRHKVLVDNPARLHGFRNAD
jgi:Amidohydrolase